MFGHDKQDNNTDGQAVPVSVVSTSTDDAASAPATPQDELNLPAPSADDTTTSTDIGAPELTTEVPASEPPMHAEPSPDMELSSPTITINSSGTMKDLSSLKQEALHELSPLINQLDQSPDEKYATAKMVYEETNDQALLTAVYDAAKNLPEDKAKAEAIYDVIKKINDFTTKN